MILLLCHLGVEEAGVTLPNHSLKPLPHGRVEPGSAVPMNFMGCFHMTATGHICLGSVISRTHQTLVINPLQSNF